MMNLENLYHQVKQQINRVDFELLWSGFKPTAFALYNENECYFNGRYIEKSSQFMANTAILFEGEIIAIWNVMSYPDNIFKFTALIIHEMFHAFQIMQKETRFADEKIALIKYQYHLENVSIKLEEAKLMKSIIENQDLSLWPTLLSLRQYRSHKYPFEYDYESKIEQIEGTAHFVEVRALEQLDHDLAYIQWNEMVTKINDPKQYFPIRIISYSIGALFLKCITLASSFNPMEISTQPFSLHIIQGVIFMEVDAIENNQVEFALNQYLGETQIIIKQALEKNDVVLSGEYPLISLNIYDARYLHGYATSTYFVAYQDIDEMKILNGNFVVALNQALNITCVYRQ
jgi:hypothetical protein